MRMMRWVSIALIICTHLIKLDENDEVGEHGAEYLHTPDQIG